MIKLQIIGNLGKDCIVKEVNGRNVINFSVAHTERYKDSLGNQKERTTWVECAYWTDKTGIVPYLIKGKTVYVEGAPEADAYMNKENQAAATLRMRVQNVQLIGGNGGVDQHGQQSAVNANSSYSSQATHTSQTTAAVVADDLPF